eukprot:gene28886-35884_t
MDERKFATAKLLKGLLDEGVINDVDFKREKGKLFSQSEYSVPANVIQGLRDTKELLELEVLEHEEYVRCKQKFLDRTTQEIETPSQEPQSAVPQVPPVTSILEMDFSSDSDSDSSGYCIPALTDDSSDESESVVDSDNTDDTDSEQSDCEVVKLVETNCSKDVVAENISDVEPFHKPLLGNTFKNLDDDWVLVNYDFTCTTELAYCSLRGDPINLGVVGLEAGPRGTKRARYTANTGTGSRGALKRRSYENIEKVKAVEVALKIREETHGTIVDVFELAEEQIGIPSQNIRKWSRPVILKDLYSAVGRDLVKHLRRRKRTKSGLYPEMETMQSLKRAAPVGNVVDPYGYPCAHGSW